MQSALADLALAASLQLAGVDVASSTSAVLASMLEADTKEWKKLTQEIGCKAER